MKVYRGIGIDLGTSNTICSIMQNGEIVDISWNGTNHYLPSVVSYKTPDKPIVGDFNNSYSFYNTKRLIGKKKFPFLDRKDRKLFGGEICTLSDGFLGLKITSPDKVVTISPREVARDILSYCKNVIEERTNSPINKLGPVTIGVPANFGYHERIETMRAAKDAGIGDCYFLNEPTAAALDYCYTKNLPCGYYVVYDFGGGTFDVSLVEYTINNADKKTFRICCTKGDFFLGGVDIDEIVARFIRRFMKILIKDNPYNLFNERPTIVEFSEALNSGVMKKAKELKESFSNEDEVEIDLTDLFKLVPKLQFDESLLEDDNPMVFSITREDFQEAIKYSLEKTTNLVKDLLDSYTSSDGSSITIKDIKRIILVGGSSCLFCIPDYLSKQLGIEKERIMQDINPGLCVSHGCCRYSANFDNIYQDERDISIIEKSSYSYGVAVADGRTIPLIKKGDPIPTTVTNLFTTVKDYQEVINTAVYLGDSEYNKDNEMIQNIQFTLKTRQPKGIPQIEITYKIEQSNLLKITCCEILDDGRKIELGKQDLILNASAFHVC